MKILFGMSDVLALDAWLDHFEEKGYEVDGAMTAEDLVAAAEELSPDYLVTEYNLKGERDGRGVYYELSARPRLSPVKLILIAEIKSEVLRKVNNNFVQSGGIKGIIKPSKLSFEAVEEIL